MNIFRQNEATADNSMRYEIFEDNSDSEILPQTPKSIELVESKTVSEAFNLAGGLGRFHKIMFIILSGCLMTGEVFNSLILYFNKTPDLICTHSDGTV